MLRGSLFPVSDLGLDPSSEIALKRVPLVDVVLPT